MVSDIVGVNRSHYCWFGSSLYASMHSRFLLRLSKLGIFPRFGHIATICLRNDLDTETSHRLKTREGIQASMNGKPAKRRCSRSVSLGDGAIEILDTVRASYKKETGRQIGYTNAVYLLAGRPPRDASRPPSNFPDHKASGPHDVIVEITLAPGSSVKDHNFQKVRKFGVATKIWEDGQNRRITISLPFWPSPWLRSLPAKGRSA